MKKKILILAGGISKERLISLDTGLQVAKELKKNGYKVKISVSNLIPVSFKTLSDTNSINFFISSNLAFPLLTKKLQCFSEIHASPKDFSSDTDSFINCHTFLSVWLIGFLKVLPLVLILVGCVSSFFFLIQSSHF